MTMRTLVDDRWRITLYRGVPWGELYDLAADPHELHNLWDEPAHAADKLALTERLAQKMMALAERSPRPTHAQLLDWLAVELATQASRHLGWSMKHLHRLMVTSGTAVITYGCEADWGGSAGRTLPASSPPVPVHHTFVGRFRASYW